MKFILKLSCDDENDSHDKAVVEVDRRMADTLLKLREILHAAAAPSPVYLDEITFNGPGCMCVVAVKDDRICDDTIRKEPPTVDEACVDPDAELNWSQDELDFDEARTELDRTCVREDGVRWTSYLQHSNVKLFSATVPWAWIECVSRGELP